MEQEVIPSQNGTAAGKKIFLLYPHSVIRDEMTDELIMAGYETYTIFDEKRALKLLMKFPGSIMFINIDEGLSEKEWESYVWAIQNSPKTKSCRLGIMSYNQNKDLMQKYLMELAVPCGYIQLKLGLQESKKIILSALETTDARGRRSNIRVDCSYDIGSVINYKGELETYRGNILDISSVGVAAKFEKLDEHSVNSIIQNVQLKLRNGIVMTDMIFAGQRRDNKQVYILLYGSKLTKEDKRVIHHYIKVCLQKYIDELKV
jgi:hypothetical protein